MNSQDENRPAGVTTIDHSIKTIGVEDQTIEAEEQYEYVNLQGVFGDILSNETIEDNTDYIHQ